MQISVRQCRALFATFGLIVAATLYGASAYAVGSPASDQIAKLTTNNAVSDELLRPILGRQASSVNYILLAERGPASPPPKPPKPPKPSSK